MHVGGFVHAGSELLQTMHRNGAVCESRPRFQFSELSVSEGRDCNDRYELPAYASPSQPHANSPGSGWTTRAIRLSLAVTQTSATTLPVVAGCLGFRHFSERGLKMSYQLRDATFYLLEIWQQASMADYAHIVLAIVLCGWFIGRYGRQFGT